MWKIAFVALALAVSVSPVDAAPRKVEKSQRTEDLRRDVERISKEIYPPQRPQQRPPQRPQQRR
jgi:hypothetical protein